MDVINQTVGDALSDLLLVETVLHAFGWSVADWDAAYTDLPNRQMKVHTVFCYNVSQVLKQNMD